MSGWREVRTRVSSYDEVGTRNDLNRVEWVKQKLRDIPAGSRLLDAGAGEQRFRNYCDHLQYVAQDFGRYDGIGDSAGLHTQKWDQANLDIVSDITAIPESAESFDAILCTEVLEHVPDPIAALRELSRLLRRQGTLILTAPFCSLTHFAPYHFYSGFNRYFFERHLKNAGFDILEITTNGNFFEFLAQEVRRLPEVAGRYGKGRLGLRERIGVRILLRWLQRMSALGDGSAELLNFGFHVLARKVG